MAGGTRTMSEQDGSAADLGIDDDELVDVLDADDDDIGDEAIDLGEELDFDDQVLVQQYVPDDGEAVDAGGLAFGVEDDANGEDDASDEDEDDEEDEDEQDEDRLLSASSFVGAGLAGLT